MVWGKIEGMMKKVKRKYTRRVSPEGTESNSSPIKASEVTQADIELLPPSLRLMLEQGTRFRKAHHLRDNLKEMTEMMVRRFRGH